MGKREFVAEDRLMDLFFDEKMGGNFTVLPRLRQLIDGNLEGSRITLNEVVDQLTGEAEKNTREKVRGTVLTIINIATVCRMTAIPEARDEVGRFVMREWVPNDRKLREEAKGLLEEVARIDKKSKERIERFNSWFLPEVLEVRRETFGAERKWLAGFVGSRSRDEVMQAVLGVEDVFIRAALLKAMQCHDPSVNWTEFGLHLGIPRATLTRLLKEGIAQIKEGTTNNDNHKLLPAEEVFPKIVRTIIDRTTYFQEDRVLRVDSDRVKLLSFLVEGKVNEDKVRLLNLREKRIYQQLIEVRQDGVVKNTLTAIAKREGVSVTAIGNSMKLILAIMDGKVKRFLGDDGGLIYTRQVPYSILDLATREGMDWQKVKSLITADDWSKIEFMRQPDQEGRYPCWQTIEKKFPGFSRINYSRLFGRLKDGLGIE